MATPITPPAYDLTRLSMSDLRRTFDAVRQAGEIYSAATHLVEADDGGPVELEADRTDLLLEAIAVEAERRVPIPGVDVATRAQVVLAFALFSGDHDKARRMLLVLEQEGT